MPPTVALDLRDPARSGIARVARSVAQALLRIPESRDFRFVFAGPEGRIRQCLDFADSAPNTRIVPWESGRLDATAELTWPHVAAASGRDVVWYFPHFDMPWVAEPRRSIVALHDLIALKVPGATTPARRRLSRWWIRRSGVRATRIVTGTQFTRDEITAEWPEFADRISVVPHGVSPVFFSPATAIPENVKVALAGAPYMVSVGNKKPHKNLVIGAEVLARIPDLRWVVVGERFRGWEDLLIRARALGVQNRVIELDPVPDSTLTSLYASSACLFFPSRHEGFGLPILEALAAGTRVVIGRAGASVEVMSGHGIACDFDDADAFVHAVSTSITLGPPGPEGRRHAATFTWERAARSIISIVGEISGSGAL